MPKDPTKRRADARDYRNPAVEKLREEEIARWRRAFPHRPEYWPTEGELQELGDNDLRARLTEKSKNRK